MTLANKIGFALLCTIIVVSTVIYGTVHQPIIALFYIATAALFFIWAADGYKSGELRIPSYPLPYVLLLLSVYAIIQAIPFGSVEIAGVEGVPWTISVDPFQTKLTAVHIFFLFIFFIAAAGLLNSSGRLQKIAAVITIFGFVYAFFAILQSVLSPDKIYGIYERQFASPFGSFVNRHNFAAYMEMTLAIPLGLVFAGAVPKDKRLLYFTAIGLMGVALILSGSRGGLVAFFAELIMLLLMTAGKKGKRSMLIKGGLAAGLFVAIVAGSIFVGGETSLSRIAESTTQDDISSERSHIWSVTVDVIGSNMPFGAGLGAFGRAYARHDDQNGLATVEQAHNDYLQVLADAGIPGLVIGLLFLFLILKLGYDGLKIRNTFRRAISTGAFAGCFGILVHSIFDFVLHVSAVSILFIVLMAILIAAREEYTDDVQEPMPARPRRRSKGRVSSISEGRRPSERRLKPQPSDGAE